MSDATTPHPELTEDRATEVVWAAVEKAGGTRSIYRNPRMAFAFNARRKVQVKGYEVDIRYGEISTPAIATVDGWVFEIFDEEIEILMRPKGR
jgi:hypothetical protein